VEFRIADTFTDSLTKLTSEEQKRVKTTAFDLQMDPKGAGMSFHRLGKIKDKNFRSVRASDDLRIIVHQTGDSLLLCYVAHHDDAYSWAERRKLETHPTTGAAQLVEVREEVEIVHIPKYVEVERPAPRLFAKVSDDTLLGYGVPPEWLADVRDATEASILDLAEHLPAEAAEALLNLAVGVTPPPPEPVPAGGDPFAHPDALRRFRVMNDVDELQRALDYPWEKWTVFLHPAQQRLVERNFNGPARVGGSAGTGKTIVALHRAVFLARTNPDERVLFTTFSDSLANALRGRLRVLIANQPRLAERLEVHSLDAIGERLYELHFGSPKIASREELRALLQAASGNAEPHKFSQQFLLTEWEQVVDAWQLRTWEEYRDVARLGRKTRLPEKLRLSLGSIFEQVWAALHANDQLTTASMFARLTTTMAEGKSRPFDVVVVDEAQDVNVAQLRFLAAMAAGRPNGLFFAGDLGQRIFQQAFSWKSLGVDVRGRARTLRVNYRTSHQIRMEADRLLGAEVSDVDGLSEDRRGTVSVFNGPAPAIQSFGTETEEAQAVAEWLHNVTEQGVQPNEIGVFVRSEAEVPRAIAAVKASGLPYKLLNENMEPSSTQATVATMHLAKGLEFRAVVVMACDDDVIPSQERIESVADDADLAEVYETERQLLYVACTRARDHLLVTSGGSASEFLDDLRG
jgi:hypothetical protein